MKVLDYQKPKDLNKQETMNNWPKYSTSLLPIQRKNSRVMKKKKPEEHIEVMKFDDF